MTGHIIVAAADHDGEFAQKVADHLTSAGFAVRRFGAEPPATSAADIKGCAAFVPIVSDHSLGQGPVQACTTEARAASKLIVALRLSRRDVDWLEGEEILTAAATPARNLAPTNLVNRLMSLLDHRAKHARLDIRRTDDLIRYAVHAQLIHVQASPADVARGDSEIDEHELTEFLAGRTTISSEALRALDDVIVTFGYARGRTHVGGLAQFAVRMRELNDGAAVSTRIPPGWTTNTLGLATDDEVHVLVQASTLVNSFLVADRHGISSETIRNSQLDAIIQVVDRLILLAGGPQTPRQIEAQLLLGCLATYAFDIVRTRLYETIQFSPLGFRSWRSVTKLLMIARNMALRTDAHNAELVSELRSWLLDLVGEADELRKSSLYPGRSLDLELFIAIPWDWGLTESGDVVTKALYERAKDGHVTLRERGTAAMGIWQRAMEYGKTDEVREKVEELIDLFERPPADSEIGNGLRWVARTLRAAVDTPVGVLNDLPAVDEPWYDAVEAGAAAIGATLPEWVRDATRHLFRHALLQNAGVVRRRAIDTLLAGGLVEPVTHQLFVLIRHLRDRQDHHGPDEQPDKAQHDAWLRIRALFAIAFLQFRDPEKEMVQAFERVAQRVIAGTADRAEITELQEALFTISDVYGITGVEDDTAIARARRVRGRIGHTLRTLVDHDHTKDHGRQPIARALAYLLTFMAQPGKTDLSRELLEKLSHHDDEVTARASTWAWRFRWAKDGSLRPLLRGAKDDADDDDNDSTTDR